MGSLLLALALSTTPPTVDEVDEEPPPETEEPWVEPPLPTPVPPKKSKPELKPARFAVWFAPLSLFGLCITAEPELHLTSGISLFLNVGGGPLGQFVGDVGARYAINGTPFQGFYLDLRGSFFALPGRGMVLMGPGMQIGHAWRTPVLALSVGIGFNTWIGVSRMNAGAEFIGSAVTDDQVMLLPGVTQPPPGVPTVQPALRFTLGPAF